MGTREDVCNCEVFSAIVEAVWGEESVWVDYKGVSDTCMTYSESSKYNFFSSGLSVEGCPRAWCFLDDSQKFIRTLVVPKCIPLF